MGDRSQRGHGLRALAHEGVHPTGAGILVRRRVGQGGDQDVHLGAQEGEGVVVVLAPPDAAHSWQLSPSHTATRRQVSHHSQCGHSPSVVTALKSIPCWQMFAAVVVVTVSSSGRWGLRLR